MLQFSKKKYVFWEMKTLTYLAFCAKYNTKSNVFHVPWHTVKGFLPLDTHYYVDDGWGYTNMLCYVVI